MAERRVILLGKTGNGKSSTGNSILGYDSFISKKSTNSVTSICEVKKSKRTDGRVYEVCDTPGLFCNGEDQIKMALEIQKSVDICQEPHAFLLVFSGANRMTIDEKYTINFLRICFGDEIFNHCIVVITRGNEFGSDSEFKEFWSGNDEFRKIVEKCGNRVVNIENANNFTSNAGLENLLKMIEELASKGSYDHKVFKTHTEVLQEYEQQTYGLSKSEDIDKHLDEILIILKKRFEEERQKAEEEKRKAEEERKKTEERKKAEEENRKAEEERKKAEEEKRKAEEERKKAEEEKSKAEEKRKKLEDDEKRAKDADWYKSLAENSFEFAVRHMETAINRRADKDARVFHTAFAVGGFVTSGVSFISSLMK